MKKGIYLAVAAVMMTGCLTGCGSKSTISEKEIGAGASSPEKAAETFLNGMFNGELWLTVVPKEYLEYLEDEYYLTENQLKEKSKAYAYDKYREAEVTSFEVIEKNNFHDMQDLNEALSEKGLNKSEEAFELEFEFETEYGNGESMDDCCFEYDGRWYSWAAMERIEYVAENADSISVIDWDNAEICTSSKMAAEAHEKGRNENASYFFMAVPSEFIEYMEKEYNLTEEEMREEVEARTSDERIYKMIGFNIKDVSTCSLSDEQRESLANVGVNDISESYYVDYSCMFSIDSEHQSERVGPRGFGPAVVFTVNSEEGYYSVDAIEWVERCLSLSKKN